jgi:hypothetical protein
MRRRFEIAASAVGLVPVTYSFKMYRGSATSRQAGRV